METRTKELLQPQEITLADINGGHAYQDGDIINANVINKTLGSVGYMQNIVNNLKLQPDITGVNNVGTPDVKIMPDGRFQFKNLKGEKGEGVVVSVGNEVKSNLSFNSDPQTQINSKTAVLDKDGNAMQTFDTRQTQPDIRVGALGGDGFYTCSLACNYLNTVGYQRYTIDLGVKAGVPNFIHGSVLVTCSGTFYNFDQSFSTVKLLDMNHYSSPEGSYLHIPKTHDFCSYRIGNIITLSNGNYGFIVEPSSNSKCSEAFIQLLISSRGADWNPTVTQEIVASQSLPRPMYPHGEIKIYDQDRGEMCWGCPGGILFGTTVPYDFSGFDYLRVNIAGKLALGTRGLVLMIDLLHADYYNHLYINSVAGIIERSQTYGMIGAECFVNAEKTEFRANNAAVTEINSATWIRKNGSDACVTTIFGGKY